MVFTTEQNEYILEVYEPSRRTPRIAVELFIEKFKDTINETTIKKRWKEAGFILQERGGLRHGFGREGFVKLYNRYNGDMESMIQETGYKKDSLRKLCLKHVEHFR